MLRKAALFAGGLLVGILIGVVGAHFFHHHVPAALRPNMTMSEVEMSFGRPDRIDVVDVLGFQLYLATNNKLKPPFLKPAKTIYTIYSAAILLFITGGLVYVILDEIIEKSGWIPRTREVSVYVKSENWMIGEIKPCASLASKEKKEIGVLLCDQDQMLFEPHVLQVKFWGPITTERNKEWKCARESASLTCRLQ